MKKKLNVFYAYMYHAIRSEGNSLELNFSEIKINK